VDASAHRRHRERRLSSRSIWSNETSSRIKRGVWGSARVTGWAGSSGDVRDQRWTRSFAGLTPFARELVQTLSLMTDHDPLFSSPSTDSHRTATIAGRCSKR